MKKTRLLNFLRVTFLLLIFSAFSSSSWAATITGGVTLYFDASGSDWKADNARFAAYLCNGSSNSTWYSLVQVEGDIYSFTVTSGESHKNVIFCRMDPNNPTNDWGAKWNQTEDLVWDESKNLFKPNSKHNGKNTGTWSTYEEEDLPDALPDAVVCGKKTTLFFEDFGTLDGETKRKQNNQIDGQNFYTSYNYIAECKKIKNAGEYAIVATPRWSGCSSKNDNDYDNTCSCGNSDTGKWWYNTYYDHTQGGLKDGKYGGMLQFDCRNGSSTDVLFQRTVSGVCSNTLVNFSAWVTKANISDADPIKARFILRKGGADGTIIGRKDIADIKIDEGWKQISAMFNSDTLNTDGEITIQLINLASYGQNGNDILLDDLELSVCRPKATLTTSNGLTSITLTTGQPETLTAELVSGVMTNPFYLWQYKNDIQDWTPVLNVNGEPASGINKVTATVVPERPNTEYRVIVAPKSEDAYKVARDQGNTIPCGMYAITTIATLNVSILPITFSTHPKNEIVCEGSGVTFKVEAANAETYQWQKSTNNVDWVDIEGKTGTTYQINSTTKEDDNTYYRVKATNAYGTVAYSNSAKLTVNSKATISNITAPAPICAGSALTLPRLNITNNGSTVSDGNWYLDGAEYTAGTAVLYEKNGTLLQYKAISSCGGAIESNKVAIIVKNNATISDITAPEAICAGNALALPTIDITENGSTVTDGKWYLDGAEYTAGTSVPYTSNGKTLQYKATSSCGGTIESNAVTITVNDKATIADITAPEAICAGSSLSLPTPVITTNGSTVTDGKWYLDGAEYTAGTAVLYEKNGALLQYKAISSCGGEIESNKVAIIVKNNATISDITAPAAICAGTPLTLITPVITENGSTVTNANWYLDGEVYTEGESVLYEKNGKTLQYKATSSCGGEIKSNEVTIVVDALPVVTLSATDVTLNCTTQTATITASGAYKYEWSYLDQTGATQTKSGSTLALQQTDPEVSSLVTEYTVYGYSENANCQSVEAKTVKVTEDFVKPVASIKVSERTDGTIQEWLDCNQETIKLEADITLNTVTIDKYIWSDGSDADNTIINKADTYTLQVVGKNGCKSEVATKTIAENVIKPQVSIDSYVKDPITGEIATQTKLTCTNKEITLDGKVNNADEYSENYPNGEFTYLWSDGATTSSTVARTPLASSPMEYTLIVTAPNGCDNSTDKAKVTITEDVTQPVLDIKEVYELCPSDTLTKTTLSSLLPKTSGVTYKFYDEFGDEIEDLYDASSAITEYYVTGASANGCESEKVSFAVDLAKNVDFTLTASQTSMLVGGNETVITIIPNAESDEADTYTWQANGNEIAVDGLEYSTNLYLDTKFEVTAINRCDSKSQEVSIEVLWPTAFTPHNDNGKNDDFAKGMPIIVFNRFYTKIFEGPDGWDGTINGTMNDSKNIAVPGVYYYKVDLPNGEVKKGTIEIVR